MVAHISASTNTVFKSNFSNSPNCMVQIQIDFEIFLEALWFFCLYFSQLNRNRKFKTWCRRSFFRVAAGKQAQLSTSQDVWVTSASRGTLNSSHHASVGSIGTQQPIRTQRRDVTLEFRFLTGTTWLEIKHDLLRTTFQVKGRPVCQHFFFFTLALAVSTSS